MRQTRVDKFQTHQAMIHGSESQTGKMDHIYLDSLTERPSNKSSNNRSG